jgi:hypothetical protein
MVFSYIDGWRWDKYCCVGSVGKKLSGETENKVEKTEATGGNFGND